MNLFLREQENKFIIIENKYDDRVKDEEENSSCINL